MKEQDLQLLADNAVLGPLPDTVRQYLLEDALELDMPAGTTLFRQGEDARFLHLVLEGRVALVGSSDSKDETIVEFFHDGDVFIMPAVILELPYLMSARTVEDSRILLIPAARFRECMEQEPALSLAASHELARHWRLLIRQVKDLKLRSAPQRLGSYLLSLSDTDGDRAEIELPEQRGMLARRLGMTPENLSRAFSRLQSSGVKSRGRQIELSDIPTLRKFCAYDDLT
jgi:CRP/FNR family transcriptional regulator, transcriptional activator FtrB